MLPTKHTHTKEGVLNEKLALKKLLTYITSVKEIPQKIKCLSDQRERKSIPLFNIVMPVLLFLMLQYESFHTVFSAPESMSKRLRNCIIGKIPKVDAVRDLLSRISPEEIQKIHEETIDILKRNRVFREGTIGRYVVAGIDGVELFSSTKKSCPDCLTRKNRAGETEHFHRSVVCMTVGKAPHVILGQEMLKPRDGAEKDEGELTGGKRLIKRLRQRHGHFADVIVADALYLNAPFINTIKENGLDAVIRLKDEKRLIFQDAEGLFNQRKGKKKSFQHGKKTIEVWDLSKFEMENCPYRLRVVRYHESWQENGKEAERWMWLATTLEETAPPVLWEMMNCRWDIEENGFHQLKTYYHAKHCYCHAAVETIFNLMIIGFNMRELYLYRRIQRFERSGITRKSVSRIFRDDLLAEKVKQILYQKGG